MNDDRVKFGGRQRNRRKSFTGEDPDGLASEGGEANDASEADAGNELGGEDLDAAMDELTFTGGERDYLPDEIRRNICPGELFGVDTELFGLMQLTELDEAGIRFPPGYDFSQILEDAKYPDGHPLLNIQPVEGKPRATPEPDAAGLRPPRIVIVRDNDPAAAGAQATDFPDVPDPFEPDETPEPPGIASKDGSYGSQAEYLELLHPIARFFAPRNWPAGFNQVEGFNNNELLQYQHDLIQQLVEVLEQRSLLEPDDGLAELVRSIEEPQQFEMFRAALATDLIMRARSPDLSVPLYLPTRNGSVLLFCGIDVLYQPDVISPEVANAHELRMASLDDNWRFRNLVAPALSAGVNSIYQEGQELQIGWKHWIPDFNWYMRQGHSYGSRRMTQMTGRPIVYNSFDEESAPFISDDITDPDTHEQLVIQPEHGNSGMDHVIYEILIDHWSNHGRPATINFSREPWGIFLTQSRGSLSDKVDSPNLASVATSHHHADEIDIYAGAGQRKYRDCDISREVDLFYLRNFGFGNLRAEEL